MIAFARPPTQNRRDGSAGRRWLATMIFGVVLGCAAGDQADRMVPAAALSGLGRLVSKPSGLRDARCGGILSPPSCCSSSAAWWSEPVGRFIRFLDSNLNRGQTIPIKIQFLGATYRTPKESLPWYNTLVWTLFVTPVGFLLLAGLGVWTAIGRWRNESLGVLFAGHWSFLMILRSLPHVPGHDGVRLFLPAFGVLALLGGVGARSLLARSSRWAKVAITAALVEGAVGIAVMMPVPLTYFSPIVGGLPGATKLGMEPTYYWDALSPEARRWLADNTLPGRTIDFRGFPHSWLYLRRTGELPRRLARIDRGLPQWVVLQNRPGAFSDVERSLIANGHPTYTVTKLGVPLIWIFPYTDLERLVGPHAT